MFLRRRRRRLLRRSLTVALAAVPVGAVGARAATPVTVSPVVSPRSPVAVTFTTDRDVTGNDWYLVEARAARKRPDCEYHEAVQVGPAVAGTRVTVRLRPYDRGRWCAGRYRGRVLVERRTSCDEPDTDEAICSDEGRITGRFTFDVT